MVMQDAPGANGQRKCRSSDFTKHSGTGRCLARDLVEVDELKQQVVSNAFLISRDPHAL